MRRAILLVAMSWWACGPASQLPEPGSGGGSEGGGAAGGGAGGGLASGGGAGGGSGGGSGGAGGGTAAPDGGTSADGGAGPATAKGAAARAIVADGGRLVDVRTPTEFDAGHLDGARNLPLGDLPTRLTELEPKSEWVVVYCRSGARSAQAAGILVDAGFSQVFDLGPMSAW